MRRHDDALPLVAVRPERVRLVAPQPPVRAVAELFGIRHRCRCACVVNPAQRQQALATPAPVVAVQLAEAGAPFLVLDQSAERVAEARERGWLALQGEATDEEVLRLAGIDHARVLATVLREHKPTHIAVAFDVSRDTFRARLYPEYKVTRAKTPDEFKGQVEQIKTAIMAALNG